MVKIICDSACDLTPELMEKYNISHIPCHVILNGSDYLDGVNISPEDIFSFVEKEGILPKTSAPSIEEITEILNRELETVPEIVVLTMSSKISGTCSFIRMAVLETGKTDRIFVVDSESLSSGLAFLAIEAAEMAEKGLAAAEIVSEIEKMKRRVEVSFVIDTLKYLHMGGRCSSLESFVGSSLHIHPLIRMNEGSLHVGKKYMGSLEHCLMKYEKEILRELSEAVPDRVLFTASMPFDTPVMEKIYDDLQNTGMFHDVFRITAGSLISSHCGPGTMGIIFLRKEKNKRRNVI